MFVSALVLQALKKPWPEPARAEPFGGALVFFDGHPPEVLLIRRIILREGRFIFEAQSERQTHTLPFQRCEKILLTAPDGSKVAEVDGAICHALGPLTLTDATVTLVIPLGLTEVTFHATNPEDNRS